MVGERGCVLPLPQAVANEGLSIGIVAQNHAEEAEFEDAGLLSGAHSPVLTDGKTTVRLAKRGRQPTRNSFIN